MTRDNRSGVAADDRSSDTDCEPSNSDSYDDGTNPSSGFVAVDDFLAAQQITLYFSRMAAKKKNVTDAEVDSEERF